MDCESQSLLRNATHATFSAVLLLLGVFVSCSPAPVATHVESPDVAELPVRQQAQIRGYLKMFFGTTSNPQLMEPTGEEPEVNEDSSAKQDTESVDESIQQSGSSSLGEGEEQFPGLVSIPRKPRFSHAQLQLGHQVYKKNCIHCHGTSGDGMGPAAPFLNPKPRDYRAGKFKFASTSRGSKPLRSDLERIIRYGAKGTSMPGFRFLPEPEVQAVIDYVMSLSQRGEVELNLVYLAENDLSEDEDFDPETVMETVTDIQDSWRDARKRLVLPATPMTAYSEESALAGRRAFLSRGCAKCHGPDGRGKTQANVGKDDWGHTVNAADLTAGMLHGGRRPIDIYRRIWAGINGTPMPAFDTALQETPETAWDLVHYIQSLAAGQNLQLLPEEEAQLLKPPSAKVEPASAEAKPAFSETEPEEEKPEPDATKPESVEEKASSSN